MIGCMKLTASSPKCMLRRLRRSRSGRAAVAFVHLYTYIRVVRALLSKKSGPQQIGEQVIRTQRTKRGQGSRARTNNTFPARYRGTEIHPQVLRAMQERLQSGCTYRLAGVRLEGCGRERGEAGGCSRMPREMRNLDKVGDNLG